MGWNMERSVITTLLSTYCGIPSILLTVCVDVVFLWTLSQHLRSEVFVPDPLTIRSSVRARCYATTRLFRGSGAGFPFVSSLPAPFLLIEIICCFPNLGRSGW